MKREPCIACGKPTKWRWFFTPLDSRLFRKRVVKRFTSTWPTCKRCLGALLLQIVHGPRAEA